MLAVYKSESPLPSNTSSHPSLKKGLDSRGFSDQLYIYPELLSWLSLTTCEMFASCIYISKYLYLKCQIVSREFQYLYNKKNDTNLKCSVFCWQVIQCLQNACLLLWINTDKQKTRENIVSASLNVKSTCDL